MSILRGKGGRLAPFCVLIAVMIAVGACAEREEATPTPAPLKPPQSPTPTPTSVVPTPTPTLPTSTPVVAPPTATLTALQLLQKGKLEAGVTSLNMTLATNLNDLAALHQRGFALLGLERYSEALVDFEKELQSDPRFSDAWLGKALALVGLGRIDEALESLDIAIALEPNNIDVIEAKQALGKSHS